MKTFEVGGYAVCTDPGAFNLVRDQAYELFDVSTSDGITWLNLGPELGSFGARRFRPASPIEDPRFTEWHAVGVPEGGQPSTGPLGIAAGTLVEVELRGGGFTMTYPVEQYSWDDLGSGSIARYRVVTEGSPADPVAEAVEEAVEEATGEPAWCMAELFGTPTAVHIPSVVEPTYTPRVQDLPDGNPKTRFGIAKPPLSLIPGLARVHLAEAFRDGAAKYGAANWRQDPVTTSTYLNAAERHLVSWQDGEETASDSGVHHLAHAAACLLILLDAQAAGTLQDDRPTAAPTAALIREKTRPLS